MTNKNPLFSGFFVCPKIAKETNIKGKSKSREITKKQLSRIKIKAQDIKHKYDNGKA